MTDRNYAAEVREAHEAWMSAERAKEDAKSAAAVAQQRYFALSDEASRMEGPHVRRLARQAEIRRLEAALKEFSDCE